MTIRCTITGSDNSSVERIPQQTGVQPAKPANVPEDFTYHEVIVPVTQGVYTLKARRGEASSQVAWEYSWNQDMDTIQTITYGSSRF